MKKVLLGVLVGVVVVVLTAGVALALPTLSRVPGTAKVASPAIDEDTGDLEAPPQFVVQLPESQLTKIVFIRYAPKFAREKSCNYNTVCEPELGEAGWCSDCKGGGGEEEPPASTCYGFLAGSKPSWNWVENYYYSTPDLGTSSALATGVWNGTTSATIFGSGTSGNYPWGDYDYTNAISYGDYDDTGMCLTEDPCVIAVAAVWFRGKNIYEYDIMFDTDYFSNAGSPDLDTVVLHEFGHGAGLDDLYDTTCVTEVMYGEYDGVDLGLGSGDTTGIRTLYGL